MSAHAFGGFNSRPSPWGYNWSEEPQTPQKAPAPQAPPPQPDRNLVAAQLAHMPVALLSTLKREKKPFTYTPGGVNLSEVLNARLQKRIERKKRYSEERKHSEEEMPTFEPPKQVIVMPTYNTPLDMYSMENALEALEVQAGLVANDRSLSSPSRSATLPRNHTFRFEEKDVDPAKGVAQSKAFRVLQIITDTEEEPATDKGRAHHRDEMRFTGIRESKAIPSKFFHTLQKITGTEETEEEEAQPREIQQRPATFERQTPISKPISQPLTAPPCNKSVMRSVEQPRPCSSPVLKRPAAFLPIKTTPGLTGGFKPVQPFFLQNGSVRRTGNSAAGTDF